MAADATRAAELPQLNTDRELWREVEGDYYAPSIFVTTGGGIGINVGGRVVVRSLREWHRLAWTDRLPICNTCSRAADGPVHHALPLCADEFRAAVGGRGPTSDSGEAEE